MPLYVLSLLTVIAMFAGLIIRPVEWLVGIVPDDAFYYLKIARNIAESGASTFDGTNPTNGYHPAWMLCLALLARLCATPEALLRGALVFALTFHLATSYCLARGLRSWMPRDWSWLGGALWALNPLPFILALEAMESCVYVFGLALTFWFYSARISPHRCGDSPGIGPSATFGLMLALCILGRTEAVILSAAALLAAAIALPARARYRFAATVGVAVALGVAPWFCYSRWATGAWMQQSGAMKMLWAHEAQGSLGARLSTGVRYVLSEWAAYPLFEITGRHAGAKAIAALAVSVIVVHCLRRGRANPDTRHPATIGLVLFLGTFVTGAVYGFFFSDRQHWYRAQPGFALFLVVYGLIVLFLLRREGPRSARGWLSGTRALVVVLAGLSLFVRTRHLNTYPWQRAVFTSQPLFEALVPSGKPIGSFNAGIPGFFSSRTIINLDGLVNNAVYPFYRQHAFEQYLEEARIEYVLDEQEALARGLRFAAAAPKLEVIARMPLPEWHSGPRFLWRRTRSSEARLTP